MSSLVECENRNQSLALQWLICDTNNQLMDYSVLKLNVEELPDSIWDFLRNNHRSKASHLLSVTVTPDEISCCGPSALLKTAILETNIVEESGFIGFRIIGTLDFAMVGVLAAIAQRLAMYNISILALSTFNTDYILVNKSKVRYVEMILHEYHNEKYKFFFDNLQYNDPITSRINTIIGGITRISALPLPQEYVIHIVGAEENECYSLNEEMLAMKYSRLFDYFAQNNVNKLHIEFIGPNIIAENSRQIVLKHKSMNIQLDAHVQLYHEYNKHDGAQNKPNLVVLFNAGVWGYADWLPTLAVFDQLRSDSYVLITSYTMEEADDDDDTIVEYFNTHKTSKSIEFLWKPELNCHHTSLEYVRGHGLDLNRKYIDNMYWYCFHFTTA